MTNRDTAAVLVCAGNATRMRGIHKILHQLGDSCVLETVVEKFAQAESIAEVIIVCRQQDMEEFTFAVKRLRTLPPRIAVTAGGATRQESVRKGVTLVSGDCKYVAIHDGARPLVSPADIERVIAAARSSHAATLGVPVKDTIKTVENGIITGTPERAKLWQTQTPQVFERTLYRQAMELAEKAGKDYTDDCQLVEATGQPVSMLESSYRNIKLTTPEDFLIAEAFLGAEENGGMTE